MGHMGLFEPQSRGSNEAFEFGRFSGEVIGHVCDLGDHAFPALAAFAALQRPKHFVFRLHSNLGQRYVVLGGFVLLFLFNLGRNGLAGLFVLTIQKIRGNGAILRAIQGRFGGLFFEGLDLLAELNLGEEKNRND